MAATSRHPRNEQLAIAALTGTAHRWANHIMRGNLDHPTEAITELHTISTDVHLLAHAISGTRHWQHSALEALLLLAGADPEDLAAIAADIDQRSPF